MALNTLIVERDVEIQSCIVFRFPGPVSIAVAGEEPAEKNINTVQ